MGGKSVACVITVAVFKEICCYAAVHVSEDFDDVAILVGFVGSEFEVIGDIRRDDVGSSVGQFDGPELIFLDPA